MFIGRQMRLALLISFLWHLFWMSSVSIVFLPSAQKLRRYSAVYFFGSILKNPISIGQPALPYKKHLAEFPAEADIQRQGYFIQPLLSRRAGFNERPSMLVEKETLNPDGFIDLDVSKESIPSAAESVSAKNFTPQREIIFQPHFPKYPEWTQQENRASIVIFKIYISADGLVEQTINVQGSGNPEIDAALARYIRRWRFAPVAGQRAQWQAVKIDLDLE